MRGKPVLGTVLLGLGLTGLVAGLWISMESTTTPPVYALKDSVPEVTVAELQQGELDPVMFIDVRNDWERALDRIEPSLSIPLPQIESGEAIEHIQSLIAAHESEDPTVVLYCARGVRSAQAQQELAAVGVEAVSLQGGITAWRQALAPAQEQVLTQQIATPLQPQP